MFPPRLSHHRPLHSRIQNRYLHDPLRSVRREGSLGVLFTVGFCSLMIVAEVRQLNPGGWIMVLLMGLITAGIGLFLLALVMNWLRR